MRLFRTIVSVNQLSFYAAVANMCEEYESGQIDKVMIQSIVQSEIKTEVPLENVDPAYQNLQLQRFEKRMKCLSRTDRVRKICMDAGFIGVVEIGQYLLTKDNGEQLFAKTCREYILARSDGSSQPGKHKNWTRVGSYDQLSTW